MAQPISDKKRKTILWLILLTISAGVLIYWATIFYELAAKTYYIDESKLYRIDTFHLFARAYEQPDNSGGKWSSKSYLEFTSINGYSFFISDNVFLAIKDKQKLEDTLMYHDIKFTVFSDKESYIRYRNSTKPISLKVYQIQVGDTKYIDITWYNKLSKSKRLGNILFPVCVIFFLCFVMFYKRDVPDWWTKQKVIIWSISFFLTILGILIAIFAL